MDEMQNGYRASDSSDQEAQLIQNAKKIALLVIGLAFRKYEMELEKQQEISMNLADIVIEVFAMESSWLRSRKLAQTGKAALAADLCAVLLPDAMARIELSARNVLGACSTGEMLDRQISILRRLAAYEPANAIELRRKIAGRLLERERYTL